MSPAIILSIGAVVIGAVAIIFIVTSRLPIKRLFIGISEMRASEICRQLESDQGAIATFGTLLASNPEYTIIVVPVHLNETSLFLLLSMDYCHIVAKKLIGGKINQIKSLKFSEFGAIDFKPSTSDVSRLTIHNLDHGKVELPIQSIRVARTIAKRLQSLRPPETVVIQKDGYVPRICSECGAMINKRLDTAVDTFPPRCSNCVRCRSVAGTEGAGFRVNWMFANSLNSDRERHARQGISGKQTASDDTVDFLKALEEG